MAVDKVSGTYALFGTMTLVQRVSPDEKYGNDEDDKTKKSERATNVAAKGKEIWKGSQWIVAESHRIAPKLEDRQCGTKLPEISLKTHFF